MADRAWGWRQIGPDPDDVPMQQINLIAFEVRDGEAKPEDARALMELFCKCVEQGAIPDRLIKHVRDSFLRYLDTGCTIDAALGLTRKRGAPKGDQQHSIRLAAAVLRARLAGDSHQEALETAADKCDSKKTMMGEAWSKHRLDAVAVVRNERQHGFSEDEKHKLVTILKRRS